MPSQVTIPAAYAWPALGDFDFEVVGESHYQAALEALAGLHGEDGPEAEFIALLVPDDKNAYDNKAVRVDIQGRTVGYLSREDARKFRRRLTSRQLGAVPTSCAATITGGFMARDGKRASYGVRLDIKPFE